MQALCPENCCCIEAFKSVRVPFVAKAFGGQSTGSLERHPLLASSVEMDNPQRLGEH